MGSLHFEYLSSRQNNWNSPRGSRYTVTVNFLQRFRRFRTADAYMYTGFIRVSVVYSWVRSKQFDNPELYIGDKLISRVNFGKNTFFPCVLPTNSKHGGKSSFVLKNGKERPGSRAKVTFSATRDNFRRKNQQCLRCILNFYV